MKGKVSAVAVVILGVIVFVISWGKFVDVFNATGRLPESARETCFTIVGQAFLYFILSAITILFGVLLFGSRGTKLKFVRTTFFAVWTIWLILEIPIYKCDFYKIRHSFWDSRRGHFH